MFQHWTVLLIWAKESVTFPVTIERLSFYSSGFLLSASTQCFCTIIFHAFARPIDITALLLTFAFSSPDNLYNLG